MSKNKHKRIADAFAKLNSTLNDKKDKYLEDISKIINKAVKKSDDKGLDQVLLLSLLRVLC